MTQREGDENNRGDERDEPEDQQAILDRRRLLLTGTVAASAVSLAVCKPCLSVEPRAAPCLSVPMERPPVRFAPGARRIVSFAQMPPRIVQQLPMWGIYAAGGGLTSRPWRCIIDLRGSLSAGRGDAPGASSVGPLSHEWTVALDEAALREVAALADRVWREERAPNLHPIADYDEVIALRDEYDGFFLQGFGPLRGGAAEALIARLRALADTSGPSAPQRG